MAAAAATYPTGMPPAEALACGTPKTAGASVAAPREAVGIVGGAISVLIEASAVPVAGKLPATFKVSIELPEPSDSAGSASECEVLTSPPAAPPRPSESAGSAGEGEVLTSEPPAGMAAAAATYPAGMPPPQALVCGTPETAGASVGEAVGIVGGAISVLIEASAVPVAGKLPATFKVSTGLQRPPDSTGSASEGEVLTSEPPAAPSRPSDSAGGASEGEMLTSEPLAITAATAATYPAGMPPPEAVACGTPETAGASVPAPREALGIASGAILVLIEASAVPVAGVFPCLPLPLQTAAGFFFVGMAGIGRSLERNTELALWDVLQQNAKNMFKL